MRAIKMLNKMHNSKADQCARYDQTASSAAKFAREWSEEDGDRANRHEGRNILNMGHEHSDLETTALKNKDKLSDGTEKQNP